MVPTPMANLTKHGAAPRARAVCALAQVLFPALGRTRTQMCPGKVFLKRAVVLLYKVEGRARTEWFAHGEFGFLTTMEPQPVAQVLLPTCSMSTQT